MAPILGEIILPIHHVTARFDTSPSHRQDLQQFPDSSQQEAYNMSTSVNKEKMHSGDQDEEEVHIFY